jgi:Carboxypeptidase regulatory-like domain
MPGVDPKQTPPPPMVEGKGSVGPYDQYFQPQPQPGQPQSQYRQLPPGSGKPGTVPPPAIKLDKIAQGNGTLIDGQVVSAKNAPKSGVQLTFVSAQKQAADKLVTTNANGQFQVELPAGAWLVYMRGADGQYVFHSRIDVDVRQKTPMILVSR